MTLTVHITSPSPEHRGDQQREERQADQAKPTSQATTNLQNAVPRSIQAGDQDARTSHDQNQQDEGRREPDEETLAWQPSTVWGDTAAQWIMAVFAIVAAGASVAAVVLLKFTLDTTKTAAGAAKEAVVETRKATAEAKKTTDASIQAAKEAARSADAAERQADAAQETIEAMLSANRPHIDFESLRVTFHNPDATKMMRADLAYELKNTGAAVGFMNSISFDVYYGSIGALPEEPVYRRPKAPMRDTVSVDKALGQKHEARVRELPAEIVEAIQERKTELVVYGILSYRDMYGWSCASGFAYRFLFTKEKLKSGVFHTVDKDNYWREVWKRPKRSQNESPGHTNGPTSTDPLDGQP